LIQEPRRNDRLTAVQMRLNIYNTEEDPTKFTILDNLKVPVSKLNQIRSSAKKVFRSLYKYFDSEQDFNEKFTNFVNDFFQKKPQERIDKKDIEFFLANFSYNKHGFTQVSNIPNLIYQYFNHGKC